MDNVRGSTCAGCRRVFVRKPRVLVACPPFAFPTVERALGAHADLMYVNRLMTARAELLAHDDISMVVCGVQFDESRMFDLLQFVRRERSDVPFVCIRVLDEGDSRMASDAIATAVKALGGVGFVDAFALFRDSARD